MCILFVAITQQSSYCFFFQFLFASNFLSCSFSFRCCLFPIFHIIIELLEALCTAWVYATDSSNAMFFNVYQVLSFLTSLICFSGCCCCFYLFIDNNNNKEGDEKDADLKKWEIVKKIKNENKLWMFFFCVWGKRTRT